MTWKHIVLSATAVLICACSGDPVADAAAQSTSSATQAAKPKVDAATQPEIGAELIRDNIYLLTGPGGNIGLSIGEDGAFVIDDKFARFGEQIIETVQSLTDAPIKFVINTHYHGDHTGANAILKDTGATVIAHDNVRKRMGLTFENKLFGRTVDATSPELWPTVTFSQSSTFHFNGQTVKVIHTPHAHTDGDSIIYFEDANILHMGDNYFKGMFPYIDVDAGGSLQGMIKSHNQALSLANADTVIIPGHGALANKTELTETRDMLVTVQNRVDQRIKSGQSLDDILADNILDDLKSYVKFIDEEKMVRISYRSLTK